MASENQGLSWRGVRSAYLNKAVLAKKEAMVK
jgi:hypothetical protein